MSESTKNTRVKAPQKPLNLPMPPKPNIPQFKKPIFNGPKFNSNFRINQNRGSGGK